MKKFIGSLFLIFFATIFPSTGHSAQKMRDMSLSVERTNRQLNVGSEAELEAESAPSGGLGGIGANSTSDNTAVFDRGNGFDMNTPLDPNMAKQIRDINARNNTGNINSQGLNLGLQNNQFQGTTLQGINNLQGRSIPLANGLPPPHRGLSQQNIINVFCSAEYKLQANVSDVEKTCISTQRQQACERFGRAAINVQRILSQAIDCEANITGYSISGCDGLDTSRIDLLKQYWQDESSSYTILFLPDMVLNTAANCAASTRRRTVQ